MILRRLAESARAISRFPRNYNAALAQPRVADMLGAARFVVN